MLKIRKDHLYSISKTLGITLIRGKYNPDGTFSITKTGGYWFKHDPKTGMPILLGRSIEQAYSAMEYYLKSATEATKSQSPLSNLLPVTSSISNKGARIT